MPQETIYLYHTPIEEAIEYLISNYGFKPDPNQKNTFGSHFTGIVPIPSLMELSKTHPVTLNTEKEGKFHTITITASYRELNVFFAIIMFLTVGLTLLIFSWPYIFLFILMPLILYVAGRLKFQTNFFSFCEKLKNEIVNPKNRKP